MYTHFFVYKYKSPYSGGFNVLKLLFKSIAYNLLSACEFLEKEAIHRVFVVFKYTAFPGSAWAMIITGNSKAVTIKIVFLNSIKNIRDRKEEDKKKEKKNKYDNKKFML